MASTQFRYAWVAVDPDHDSILYRNIDWRGGLGRIVHNECHGVHVFGVLGLSILDR